MTIYPVLVQYLVFLVAGVAPHPTHTCKQNSRMWFHTFVYFSLIYAKNDLWTELLQLVPWFPLLIFCSRCVWGKKRGRLLESFNILKTYSYILRYLIYLKKLHRFLLFAFPIKTTNQMRCPSDFEHTCLTCKTFIPFFATNTMTAAMTTTMTMTTISPISTSLPFHQAWKQHSGHHLRNHKWRLRGTCYENHPQRSKSGELQVWYMVFFRNEHI